MIVSKEEVLKVMKESKFSHAILVLQNGQIVDAILFDVLYNKLFELVINYKKFVELLVEHIYFEIIDDKVVPVNVLSIPIVSADGQGKQEDELRRTRGYQ